MHAFALAAVLAAAPPVQPPARDPGCLFTDDDPPGTLKYGSYFEPSLFACDGDRTFYGNWYGRHLQAMGEPSFATAGTKRDYALRVRLIVLPSFTPAYVVRVDYPAGWTAQREATLTAVTETGAGGYGPGQKVPLWSFTMNPRAAARLSTELVRANLATAPRRVHGGTAKDGEIVICADGTSYVLEILSADMHRVIARHQCDFEGDPSLVPAFYQLIRDARLTIPAEIANFMSQSRKD